eukprot:g5700.t1
MWSCVACTLDNEERLRKCCLCGTARPMRTSKGKHAAEAVKGLKATKSKVKKASVTRARRASGRRGRRATTVRRDLGAKRKRDSSSNTSTAHGLEAEVKRKGDSERDFEEKEATSSKAADCKGTNETEARVAALRALGERYMGSTLLQAAQDGEMSMVRHLIAAGVDVDFRSDSGDVALGKAAWKGHFEIAKVLLQAGAKTKIYNRYGYTPHRHAKHNGNNRIAELIEQHEQGSSVQED